MSKRDEVRMRSSRILLGSALVTGVILAMTGCAPKASNEISEMALECMKNQSSINITFTPSHESKEVKN